MTRSSTSMAGARGWLRRNATAAAAMFGPDATATAYMAAASELKTSPLADEDDFRPCGSVTVVADTPAMLAHNVTVAAVLPERSGQPANCWSVITNRPCRPWPGWLGVRGSAGLLRNGLQPRSPSCDAYPVAHGRQFCGGSEQKWGEFPDALISQAGRRPGDAEHTDRMLALRAAHRRCDRRNAQRVGFVDDRALLQDDHCVAIGTAFKFGPGHRLTSLIIEA